MLEELSLTCIGPSFGSDVGQKRSSTSGPRLEKRTWQMQCFPSTSAWSPRPCTNALAGAEASLRSQNCKSLVGASGGGWTPLAMI